MSEIRESAAHPCFPSPVCALDLGIPPRARIRAVRDVRRELRGDRLLATRQRRMWRERLTATVVLRPIAVDELIDGDRECFVHRVQAPGGQLVGGDLASEFGERANPLRALRLKRDRNLDDLALPDRSADFGQRGGCPPKLPSTLPARLAAPDRQRSSCSNGNVLAASGAGDRRWSRTGPHLSPDFDAVLGCRLSLAHASTIYPSQRYRRTELQEV